MEIREVLEAFCNNEFLGKYQIYKLQLNIIKAFIILFYSMQNNSLFIMKRTI